MASKKSDVVHPAWSAYVRFDDRATQYVNILEIKETVPGQAKKAYFNPLELDDFDTTKWYSVKTSKGFKDGEQHRCNALILKLGGELFP